MVAVFLFCGLALAVAVLAVYGKIARDRAFLAEAMAARCDSSILTFLADDLGTAAKVELVAAMRPDQELHIAENRDCSTKDPPITRYVVEVRMANDVALVRLSFDWYITSFRRVMVETLTESGSYTQSSYGLYQLAQPHPAVEQAVEAIRAYGATGAGVVTAPSTTPAVPPAQLTVLQ